MGVSPVVQRLKLHLAVSTRDTASTPGSGRSRMLCSNQARAPQLLSSCPKACKSQLLSLHTATAEAMRLELAFHDRSSHGNERPTIQDKSSPRSLQLEKLKCNNKDRAKNKKPKNHHRTVITLQSINNDFCNTMESLIFKFS